jgi:type IV pilus assembly protein PilA
MSQMFRLVGTEREESRVFKAFHEKREEGGFTLIELLVVILIIAILAAIAIPVFLNQRKKGWISQSESALKNAATAMESYASGANGDYPTAFADANTDGRPDALEGEGYSAVSGVTLALTAGGGNSGWYCMTADHSQATVPLHYYSSSSGKPTDVQAEAPGC